MAVTKEEQAWALFLSTLTPGARKALETRQRDPLTPEEPAADSDAEYEYWIGALTAQAREALLRLGAGAPAAAVDEKQARYCLVEDPDGAWSQVRLFRDAEGMARRIGSLEGEDMVVWAFFAIPMKFTRGPQRVMLLPDGKSVITIPVVEGVDVRIMDADQAITEDVRFQDDGYLGPSEASEKYRGKKTAIGARQDEDEEE